MCTQKRSSRAHNTGASRCRRLERACCQCTTTSSATAHSPTGRKNTYGKVAAAAGKLAAPTDIKVKDPKDWKVTGKRLTRLDTVGKVKSFNAATIEKRPGVKKVVHVGDSALAVAADTWWHAKTALDALVIEYD